MSLQLAPRDFAGELDVRWCPGCGDYSILAQVKKVLAARDVPPGDIVFLSGAGCAGRFVHYLDTFGFQAVPGRAAAAATGMKLVRPDLDVWLVLGDGDAFALGTNSLLHAVRRNVDAKILLLNNETLGATRGQASPTTRRDGISRTTPFGSADDPVRPAALALAAGATFVARTIDVDIDHLAATLRAAADHKGTAFVEILQTCVVFNDDVFAHAVETGGRPDGVVYLEHGRAALFGRYHDRGVRIADGRPTVVELDRPGAVVGLPTHDETVGSHSLAGVLASHAGTPGLPEAVGVLHRRRATAHHEKSAGPPASLAALMEGEAGWEVAEVNVRRSPVPKDEGDEPAE